MGIKRHLFIYNTISVLVALVAMLVVSSVATHFIADNYQHQSLSSVSKEASQVQQLLQGDALALHDWPQLNRQLQQLDFSLQVSKGDRPIFSSLDPAQSRLYREVGAHTQWGQSTPLIIQNPGGTMVGVVRDGYTIVSLSLPPTSFFLGSRRQPGEIAVLSMLISGAVAIVIIVLFSLLFTSRQVKKLLEPVNALAQAARRVEEGDFSQTVDYGGRNEFSAVCAAFNHMQEHLLAEQEKTAAYERARTDLVAGISHDLRTPLTSVKGYIKGLRDGVAQTPEKQARYLDVAYQKACEMDVLLQRLFYFSKLETGNLPMFLQPCDLGDFVRRFAHEALTGQYALILLDLMLPGCNGYDVCRMIRDKVDVPILMVTARTELVDKVRGLGLGADDYIAKPFDPAELVARVKSHLSRYARLTGAAHEEQEVITVGDLRIFPQSRRAFKGEQEIKMPNREFSLLQYLAEHPNMVFSKEKLFETIWGYDYVGDSATVTVHIGRVRDKIEDDPAHPKIIETVWGAGYRLNRA